MIDLKTLPALDLVDRITQHADQLAALLAVAMNENFTTEMAPIIRENYLWACSSLADQLAEEALALATAEVQP